MTESFYLALVFTSTITLVSGIAAVCVAICDVVLAKRRRATFCGIEGNAFCVYLRNGKVVRVPFSAYPDLRDASREKLERCHLTGKGTGICWPLLDVDLSVTGLIRDFGARNQ